MSVLCAFRAGNPERFSNGQWEGEWAWTWQFEEESSEQRETAQNAEKWVALIRQYNDLQELTAGIIRELITKIYVGDVRKVDGEKVQSIEIHYRFIGSLPDGALSIFLRDTEMIIRA